MVVNPILVVDDNEQIVDIDVLKKQITNHGGLCYGRVVMLSVWVEEIPLG